MLLHEIVGRPVDSSDDTEPLRLMVSPGTATAQEIAEVLNGMSELAEAMGIEGGISWEASGRTLDTQDRSPETAKEWGLPPNHLLDDTRHQRPDYDLGGLGVSFDD